MIYFVSVLGNDYTMVLKERRNLCLSVSKVRYHLLFNIRTYMYFFLKNLDSRASQVKELDCAPVVWCPS